VRITLPNNYRPLPRNSLLFLTVEGRLICFSPYQVMLAHPLHLMHHQKR
jgi:hypothetical protein